MNVGDRFNPFRMFSGVFIPDGICRMKELSSQAKMLYGRLLRYAGEAGEAYPAIATLAEEVGLSHCQCKVHLRKLVEAKLIEKELRVNRTTVYHFLWHEVFEAGRITTLAGMETHPERGGSPPPKENHLREPLNKKTPLPPLPATAVAKEIHDRHPAPRRDCGVREVEKRLKAILVYGRTKAKNNWRGDQYVLDWINSNHLHWCSSPQWKKDDGEFAKGLANWLAPTIERYFQKPPEPAVEVDYPEFS